MSRARRKTPRTYAVLAYDYYLDDRFSGLPDSAETLWTRGLCWVKGRGSDGWIDRAHLAYLKPGSRTLARDASALVKAGLWVEGEGGYRIHQWERWNLTAAEREGVSEARRAAARARWSDPA